MDQSEHIIDVTDQSEAYLDIRTVAWAVAVARVIVEDAEVREESIRSIDQWEEST